MDLSCGLETRGGLAIVTGRLRNDSGSPKRVRIANALEGPVLPPRRRGVPEPGWDAAGFTCRVAPGSTRAFGYVCAADVSADRPPARIDSVGETGDDPAEGEFETAGARGDVPGDDAASFALRTLGDHRPPRESTAGGSGRASTAARRRDRTPPPTREGHSTERVHGGFEARLDRMADGLDRLERLEGGTLEDATRAVSDAGGLSAFRRDLRRLDADVERLRTLRDRMGSLIERRERIDVPVALLERLA